MKKRSEIEKELARIKTDERLSYPSANVFANAPLALVQMDLKARVQTLKWVLEGDDTDDRAAELQRAPVQTEQTCPICECGEMRNVLHCEYCEHIEEVGKSTRSVGG